MTIRRGAGTTVRLGNQAGNVFTAIPSIRSIRIAMRSGETEITNLDSTAKEYMRELADGGNATMSVFYRPGEATHGDSAGLEALFNSGETRIFIVRPNGSARQLRFSAFIMNNNYQFDPSAPMQLDCELRITGAITFENGT